MTTQNLGGAGSRHTGGYSGGAGSYQSTPMRTDEEIKSGVAFSYGEGRAPAQNAALILETLLDIRRLLTEAKK